MRLSVLIAKARREGVREVSLHPDGSIARLVFDAPKPPEPKRKEKTKQEQLEEEQAKRNPRRDALDVALEAMGSGNV